MLRFLLTLLFLLSSTVCLAHICPPGLTLENRFESSSRVFLVYVVETRLEEKLQEKLTEQYYGRGRSEFVKFVSAGYRVIENYKGEKSYTPRLLDLLGIGTGFVGLTPGIYYLVFLDNDRPYEASEMRSVDTCAVPVQHYRFDVPAFQNELDVVRKLSRNQK